MIPFDILFEEVSGESVISIFVSLKQILICELTQEGARTIAHHDICSHFRKFAHFQICSPNNCSPEHLLTRIFAHRTFAHSDICSLGRLLTFTFAYPGFYSPGHLLSRTFARLYICSPGLLLTSTFAHPDFCSPGHLLRPLQLNFQLSGPDRP